MIKSGIYKILNRINGKFYIGSAVDIERRYKKHVYHLNFGDHPNPYLAAAWLKYSSDNFELIILRNS